MPQYRRAKFPGGTFFLRSRSRIAGMICWCRQRRYWEHVIRNEIDLRRYIDYVHFNPVKHGLVSRVVDWPHSTFREYVEREELPSDWGGDAREIAGSFGE